MSNEIKMSELFPEAFQVEHNKSFAVQNCHWVTFGEDFHSNCEQDSAIEYAVLNHDRLVHQLNDRTIALNTANKVNAKLTQENARLTELAAQKASRCDEFYELLLSCRSALHEANMYVGFDFNAQLDNISRLVSKINNEGSDNE